MDKHRFIKGGDYRVAAVITGLGIMLLTGFYNVRTSFVLFPVFAFFLCCYVYQVTRKVNMLFILFLFATMISEVLFLYDFDSYVSISSLVFSVACVILLFMLKPVIKTRSRVFSKHYFLELIIGSLGLGYVLGYLIYKVSPLVPNMEVFIVSDIIFIITIGAYFITPGFNKHTSNISLFAIGGGFLGEMIFAFIYKYFFEEIGFLLISISFGIFVKVILATYLTKIDAIDDSIGDGTQV